MTDSHSCGFRAVCAVPIKETHVIVIERKQASAAIGSIKSKYEADKKLTRRAS
jgi:hypothetical protein